MSVMPYQFFKKLDNKLKLIPCNRSISGAGRGTLTPVGECFVQVQIGNKIFRDRVIIIENLKRSYILGQVLHITQRKQIWYGLFNKWQTLSNTEWRNACAKLFAANH